MSSKPTGKRYSQDQILQVLQQAKTGTKVSDLCRSHGISEATFHRWKGRYDGMSQTELAKAKHLEDENARLKRLLAERDLEIDAIKAVLAKKW